MTLALLLVTVERDLPTANALKNMTNGAITLPAGVLLAIFGPVHWAAAAPLAAGALVGSRIGPAVPRRAAALRHALGGGRARPRACGLALGQAERLSLRAAAAPCVHGSSTRCLRR